MFIIAPVWFCRAWLPLCQNPDKAVVDMECNPTPLCGLLKTLMVDCMERLVTLLFCQHLYEMKKDLVIFKLVFFPC